jgi:hypothetical protein
MLVIFSVVFRMNSSLTYEFTKTLKKKQFFVRIVFNPFSIGNKNFVALSFVSNKNRCFLFVFLHLKGIFEKNMTVFINRKELETFDSSKTN